MSCRSVCAIRRPTRRPRARASPGACGSCPAQHRPSPCLALRQHRAD